MKLKKWVQVILLIMSGVGFIAFMNIEANALLGLIGFITFITLIMVVNDYGTIFNEIEYKLEQIICK